jgi:protein-L-isoaspartate(D-aspartate) O-methyltransferase
MNNIDLIKHLKNVGIVESESIVNALKKIDRADFVREKNKSLAYYDEALPIGRGQTISQPLTVVFMLELLNVCEGQTVMDVGSGSGWQSTLLGEIVGETGKVHAVEIIPEIFDFGKKNVEKYPQIVKRVTFHCKNAQDGLPNVADRENGFDRIICAAEVEEVPEAWREQLKTHGILVYPKDTGVYKEIKKDNNKFEKEFYPGFVFVPFVKS